MSSRSSELKDEILNQIAEQIKGLQISQQAASFREDTTNCHITKNNIHVQCLLDLLDHILLHGLKRVEYGYWPFVKELTHSETAKYIANHPQVTSDLDKGRVWIFTAFSDGLLESYIRLFVDSQSLAKKLYTKKSFVRDKERLALLQTLVSGLDFISFVLDQEWPYLGYGNQPLQDCTCDACIDKTKLQVAVPVVAIEEKLSCGNEKDDNHSIASSSLSSTSTVTAPVSPYIDRKEERSQCHHVNTTDEHESASILNKPAEETITEHASRTSRLHQFNANFQTDQFAENENIVFDTRKRKTRKHIRRNNSVEDEKDKFVCSSPVGDNGFCESPAIRADKGLDKHYEELQKTKSYEELLSLSRSHRSSFHSQESCSSLNSSLQSADSLDQFCKNFESSVNLTSEMSLNSPTLQLCDNKEKTQDLHDSKNCKEQSGIFTNDDCMQQSTADHIEGNAANDADKSARYEGIILGLPKRPLLQEIPVTSCDIRVDQNKMLALSLEVFQKNGEQFHRMLLFACGHLGKQLYFVHVLLTDHAIYVLKKVPSEEGAVYFVHLVFPFGILKKIEVGLNCQTITLASKSQQCVLFVGDEAVTRDFLSSLTTMIVKSGHGSLLSKIVSTATFQQETGIKKWLCEVEPLQSFSVDIICFSFIQWFGLSGPDASIAVLHYKSVKEGYLECKQPQYLRRAYKWTTSYFVLMNGILYEHAQQGDEHGKVVLELRGNRCGGCRRVIDADRSFAFEVVSEDGSPLIVLAASSEEEAADWIFRLCQVAAEMFDTEEDRYCTVVKCIPCCLILTKAKIVACIPDPTQEDNFQLLSDCSVENVTRLFVDNDLRNYCILEFERNEMAGTESSWFVWFKTEYELAKFERALLDAWRVLFQVDLQFLVLGESSMRQTARLQAKSIEDLYKSEIT